MFMLGFGHCKTIIIKNALSYTMNHNDFLILHGPQQGDFRVYITPLWVSKMRETASEI